MEGKSKHRVPGILVQADRPTVGHVSSFVDLFRQTFASVKSVPNTGSTSPRSLQVLNGGGDEIVNNRMSSPPKRHLADVRYSSLSPKQHGRHDKQHYGSAGDVTSVSRMNENNNAPKKLRKETTLPDSTSNLATDTVPPSLDKVSLTPPFPSNEHSRQSAGAGIEISTTSGEIHGEKVSKLRTKPKEVREDTAFAAGTDHVESDTSSVNENDMVDLKHLLDVKTVVEAFERKRIMNTVDSDNINLDEFGAVGGESVEEVQGILQKSPSDSPQKKSSSVQFNDEVTVEMFSQTDPTASSTTKATLAQGDGPSPIASLRLSRVTAPSESGFEREITRKQNQQYLNEAESSAEVSPDFTKLSAMQSEMKNKESKLGRKNSVPKLLSPAELLHRKQKAAASNQMQSASILPSTSTGTDQNIHPVLQGSETTEDGKKSQPVDPGSVGGRSSPPSDDEFPLPFDSDITMPGKSNAYGKSMAQSGANSISDEKCIDSKITENTHLSITKSNEDNFTLSGYEFTEYMIETDTHKDRKEYEQGNGIRNTKHMPFPTLPELQQKILNENFNVAHTYPATANRGHGQFSAEKKSVDTKTVSSGLSYTPPSKLHQKVMDMVRSGIITPGIGAFSYIAQPELCKVQQDIDKSTIKADSSNELPISDEHYIVPSKSKPKDENQEKLNVLSPRLGAFSYLSPPEPLNKPEELSKNTARDSASKEEVNTSNVVDIKLPEEKSIQNLKGLPYKALLKAELKELEQTKEKAKHWMKRNKRKQHLDSLWRWTQNNSQSDVLLKKALSNASTYGLMSSQESLNSGIDSEFKCDNDHDVDRDVDHKLREKDMHLYWKDWSDEEKKDAVPKKMFKGTIRYNPLEPRKENVEQWQKRCKRKERLDNIQRWTQDHSQSDILLKKTLSNESTSNVISSKECLNSDLYESTRRDDDEYIRESDGTCLHETLAYINHRLINFLLRIQDKHVNDIPISDDDFKELMLLQSLITEVSNQIEEAEKSVDEVKSNLTDEEATVTQDEERILLNKLMHQLAWARCMLFTACNSMAGKISDLRGTSVDSIESGYLAETDADENETESSVDVRIFPQGSFSLFKSISSDTGYTGDVDDSDSRTVNSKEFVDKWLYSNKFSDETAKTMSEKQEVNDTKVKSNTHDKNVDRKMEQIQTESCNLDKDEADKSGDISVTEDSLEVHVPESEGSSVEFSPRTIKMMTCLEYPEDTREVEVDLGPSYVRLDREGWYSVEDEAEGITADDLQHHLLLMEGSPDRGQRLFGSSQNLDRRDGGGGKRKQASRSMTPDSRFMLDKEVTESQNRKLQTEIATLQTENKLLKEKYNRAQGRISDLETQLSEAQEDLGNLQESLNQEVSDLSARTKQEISRDRDGLETKILALSKENEAFKSEISSLEKKLESSHRATDMARHNSEKSRTLEAQRSEISSLKEELGRVKALLEQSERHLHDEEERHSAAGKEIVKLTELKNALQQQCDTGGSAQYTDKQLKSLEKRLKVTEDRLHQERADRANNLSAVEDKLLTENAKLQASEKELSRQLHREKEKNRNFEQRVKQLREENEKLRLAMPFDDAALLSNKGNYDIPYSSHSNQRAETMKHISDDMNYILSQIEKQDGLQSCVDEEIIRTLWNKRELAYRQLREYDLQFQELHITDNNIADGLKNLRDTYGQAESKLREMEEQVEDAKAHVSTLDATYQQQLTVLVNERHEAFARLKTAEDLLEAVRAENEMLHCNLSVGQSSLGHRQPGGHTGKNAEALQAEVTNLESKVSQLTRASQLMEAEQKTIHVQLDARDQALKDVQTELDLAYSRLKGDDTEDRKQEKIDKLSAQVNSLQVELRLITDKCNSISSENTKLESDITSLRKQAGSHKTQQHKSEQSDSKTIHQLKDDIEERDSKLTSLTKQLDDLENQLQKTRQDLYIEQMHTAELESENENLQQTVSQRAQMFESLSGSEREQLAQYQILKETLDSVSQELAQKHAQIISLDVNLSGARDQCAELEEEVRRLRKVQSGGDEEQEGFTEDEQSSAHQLKIKELEKERSLLKQELEQAYSAIQASEEQYRTLQTESAQLEQELVKEKTVILQITAEKGEIEQHLEELAEEHESLIQEKTQAEEDLIKLETKLQEILQKYETQARKQHNNFEQEYPGLPPEARQLISELEALTLIVEGKEREISIFTDKLNRQNIEIDFLHRKVELVHNDSIANREDIARMISELTLKMKEAVSTREVNQFLVGERTKLQNEKTHLEKELDIERKNNDERKKEIQDVIRKIERTETSQKSTEKDSRNKDNAIISLESELRNTKHNLTGMETEVAQLRNKLDHLNEDLKNLTGINGSLEKRLETEKNSLMEEKNAVSKWKEEYKTLSHDFEVLQHDHTLLCDKYQTELETVDKLKRELEVREEEVSTMREDLSNTKVELDSNKGQLLITKDTVQKLTQDKSTIYQDYEGMCRSLTEKERQLTELKERTSEKIEHLKKEHMQEKLRLEQDRAAAVQEKDMAKKEMDNINEQLRQKEIQLNTFGKTLQELESVTREKKRLEAHLQNLESSSGDSKVLLDGQRKELMALNEALAKLQERNTRLEAENHTVHADLKAQKESGNREAHELSIAINELKSQHENERHYLNDNLSQTQTRLRSVEASLASAASDRDSLQAKARLHENTIEELQSKMSDESTGRRLAEQSVGTLRLQLEDMKNDKNVAEARFVEMQNQLMKAEDKLKREEEKCMTLSAQLQEVNAVSHTTRSNIKAKSEQVDMLQKEICNLKQMIETQKQNLNGKMKKSTLEYKQQIENIEEEKDKLQLQNQQLSSDLDSCREHIASKNKENLKLQEEILVLEDSVRECKVKQKHAEDTLRVEADKQAELNASLEMEEKWLQLEDKWFEAQEEELKRLRNFLAKKVEQSGDSDKTMWQEMNRVIQDLSRQMTSHLDSTRGGDKDKSPESLVSRLRKQLADTQGELSTEKSLHQITKTSLVALEEDCQRLRKQLHQHRRRDPPSGEKKHKNRMEAINAIIARSQSQAQALLASGGYFDDSMVSPRVRSHQPSPRVGFHSPRHAESPDNSYSEDLSVASLPPMHYGLPASKS
ncbi:uncharacterized protein LOC123523252 isoform X2 [Mercenaria mercenaria]|uniref:uncharacterized protein LOC123523252 isoform X2 n=1 Tax=Mercenaria mercenaria TaxID=6596 RepID=UPI00234F4956|nr:uncharacterized protein LOC123523252 isoform X2 [Mercenaria mercenaria]